MLSFRSTFITLVLTILIVGSQLGVSNNSIAQEGSDLPAPQLVTGAWMFIAAYKADPKVLKEMLPPGLKPNPAGQIVMNMYTVPNPGDTSGFGAYTLTYFTIELEGQDSYVMNSDITYPGRYFVYYFNSSPIMRGFTKPAGIPAQEGLTTTVVKDGKLTATLTVDGKPFIVSTADVGSELGNFGSGHLNYFGLIDSKMSDDGKSKVVKYPIPWIGGSVETKNPKIMFKAPKGHPINKIMPIADPTWAVWMKGSFVYPQYQVINEF